MPPSYSAPNICEPACRKDTLAPPVCQNTLQCFAAHRGLPTVTNLHLWEVPKRQHLCNVPSWTIPELELTHFNKLPLCTSWALRVCPREQLLHHMPVW